MALLNEEQKLILRAYFVSASKHWEERWYVLRNQNVQQFMEGRYTELEEKLIKANTILEKLGLAIIPYDPPRDW